MRKYIDLTISCPDEEMAEIATAFLADFPFESFDTAPTTEGATLHAFILKESWAECREEALATAADYGTVVSEEEIEDENWNERWEEESFSPVDIDNKIVIRAAHHPAPADAVIDIIVKPSMSFGSGHHHTTRMMCRAIHSLNPSGRVLDVGCGTGVLSIAAIKCGAEHADAVDIDPWSTASAEEAALLNGIAEQISVLLGTVEVVEGRKYDMVLANINRNIILNDIDRYVEALNDGGKLLLSGFLVEDIADITTSASERGLCPIAQSEEEGWVCLVFKK
ncbi:MAG: 50S ribosomal protein L11 methyltransferase [Alistipes sp.]|nr:50S ribosomal protein L11 methyltransferase [Alistipes sp.]